MYRKVCPYSRCVYIRVIGVPCSGTRASSFTPLGSCALGELKVAAGNMSMRPTCAKTGRVNEVQTRRAARLTNAPPMAANNLFFKIISLRLGRSGGRDALVCDAPPAETQAETE